MIHTCDGSRASLVFQLLQNCSLLFFPWLAGSFRPRSLDFRLLRIFPQFKLYDSTQSSIQSFCTYPMVQTHEITCVNAGLKRNQCRQSGTLIIREGAQTCTRDMGHMCSLFFSMFSFNTTRQAVNVIVSLCRLVQHTQHTQYLRGRR